MVATLASTPAATSLIVLCIAYDNSGTNGADPYSSITDTQGNTWTPRQDVLNDPGAASAGVVTRIFTTLQNAAALVSGNTVTVSVSPNVTAKVWTLTEIASTVAGEVPTVIAGATASGTSSTPTITSASIGIDQCIVACLGFENDGGTMVGDSDTTNGSWSTVQQGVTTALATSGQRINSQGKVVTAAGTQTYNSTSSAGSGDWGAAWIEVGLSSVLTPGVLALALTPLVPIPLVSPMPGTLALVLTPLTPRIPDGRDDLPLSELADMVWETTTSTGLGTIVLAGAVGNRRTVAQEVADGAEQTYRIAMISGGALTGEWEIVRATYDAGTNSLTRTKVLNNTYKMNQFIGWGAGTKWVTAVHSAADIMTIAKATAVVGSFRGAMF
jgi:hypothetical protein